MESTTLHPPFEQCVGDDDGYVHTLTCGTDFLLLHFYGAHAFANGSYQYISLPTGTRMRQDLVQPWEMRISLIWEPPSCGDGRVQCANCNTCDDAPPPPGATVWGPARGAGWAPVGITVDEDTIPHILTFTKLKDGGGEARGAHPHAARSGPRRARLPERDCGLDLPF
jgi:hypothetical protein